MIACATIWRRSSINEQPKQPQESKAWYEAWFGEEYLEVYSHRNQAEAASDIANILKLIPLKENQPILDLCCGNGRHSIELARYGFSVTGLDLSETLLTEARKARDEHSFDLEFVRDDMRKSPKSGAYGTVLQMFTSFGYFESDSENQKIFDAIAESLRPGGWFLIDYLNKDLVLDTLVAEDIKKIDGKTLVQKRRYYPDIKRLKKEITIMDGDQHKVFIESVRLYDDHELIKMARLSGLAIENVYGALDGRKVDPHSPRKIFVGRKLTNE